MHSSAWWVPRKELPYETRIFCRAAQGIEGSNARPPRVGGAVAVRRDVPGDAVVDPAQPDRQGGKDGARERRTGRDRRRTSADPGDAADAKERDGQPARR